MTRRTRKGRAHNARPNLSVEHLESRNLMAADTTGTAMPLLEPVDVELGLRCVHPAADAGLDALLHLRGNLILTRSTT